MGEILGRIRDGTLFKNADKVSVVAGSTDGAGMLAKHTDETGAWLHGVKVFRYSDETAEAVASGEKLLKESGTIYESFADMMSPEDAAPFARPGHGWLGLGRTPVGRSCGRPGTWDASHTVRDH